MMNSSKKFILLFLFFSGFSITFQAWALQNNHDENGYAFSVKLGEIAIFDSHLNQTAWELELTRKGHNKWKIDTVMGLLWAEQNNKYLFWGLKRDWSLSPSWIFSTGLSTGLYDNSGNIDLGYTIQFKTELTLAYQLKNQHRLGFSLSHLSNSRLSELNPGTELLMVNYTAPIFKAKPKR